MLLVVLALARDAPMGEALAWWVALVCAWSLVHPFAFRNAARDETDLARAVVTARLAVLIVADVTGKGPRPTRRRTEAAGG